MLGRPFARAFALLAAIASLTLLFGGTTPTPDSVHADVVFIVDSSGDAADANLGDGVCATSQGVCTLRAAIQQTNVDDGATIQFASTVSTITPQTDLPAISAATTVDGSTACASSPCVILDGSIVNASGSHYGLILDGNSATMRGLMIGSFDIGLAVWGNGNVVAGNYFGTADGLAAARNDRGIDVGGSNNTIGGATAADRNVISGNGEGIHLDHDVVGNHVSGNFIGTNKHGTATLPNIFGVHVDNSGANEIGGSALGEGNLISGNLIGIVVDSASDTKIRGNYIGVDITGSLAVPNSSGIEMSGSSGTVIGGAATGARNVISGNSSSGIAVDNSTASVIANNAIGTTASGAPLGNGGAGVWFDGQSHDNLIGGTDPGSANVIAYNHDSGVVDEFGSLLNNAIRRNSIHSNDADGIQLLAQASRHRASRILHPHMSQGSLVPVVLSKCFPTTRTRAERTRAPPSLIRTASRSSLSP